MDISELNRTDLTSINRHPWELTRSRIIFSLLKKYSQKFDTLIDFGSGDIYVLHELELRQTAENYYAIDNAYSESLITRLKSTTGTQKIMLKNSVNEIEKQHLPADCILFLDVLEHCRDDKDVLQSVISKELPANNALVIITVPAFQSLFSEHDNLLNHYRRYNLKSLTTLCKISGLTTIESGYFFFSLLPLRIFQLFLEKTKIKKPVKSIDNWAGGKTLSKFLSFILWLDFKTCRMLNKTGIKIPGLSCYCICRYSPL